jgi:hypothetical protein
VVLRALKFGSGYSPKLAYNGAVASREANQRGAFDDQDIAVGDRVGGEGTRISDLEAEHVAGEGERSDLAAPSLSTLQVRTVPVSTL